MNVGMPARQGAETLVEVMPERSLELLSQHEVNRLRRTGEGGQHEVLRRCALAVLNAVLFSSVLICRCQNSAKTNYNIKRNNSNTSIKPTK